MFVVFNVFNLISIPLFPFILYIFDVILRTNKYHLSCVIQMLIPKHFIGRENYFYLVILHSGAGICIGGTILVATLMMYLTYIKHACGMFTIAR